MKDSTDGEKQSAPNLKGTKTREEIKAEREAKKAAKVAAKAGKSKSSTPKDASGSITNNAATPIANDNEQKSESVNTTLNATEGNLNQQITNTIEASLERIRLSNDKINSNDSSVTSAIDNSPVHKIVSNKVDRPPSSSSQSRICDTIDGCMVDKRSLLIHPSEVLTMKPKDVIQSPAIGNLVVPEKEGSPGKSKAELRAERRAKQEAQRAAKATAKEQGAQPKIVQNTQVKNNNDEARTKLEVEKKEEKPVSNDCLNKGKLFSHLYFEKEQIQEDYGVLHPSILRLGVQYEKRIVCGSNARCLALLHAFKQMIRDYSTPLKEEFSRGLESMLAKSMAYLDHHRPASVSMVNVVRHIKRHLTQIPNTVSDVEAKQKLQDIIDTYVREQIDVAGEAISNKVQKKITKGDVILIYGCSSLIYRILVESHKSGTKFSVIVVDGGPWYEGKEMLRRLVREGLHCSYVLISAASFVMREVSKVLLGAHALLANGYVMSRAGTSQIALQAHSYNVAVLVCCETHKFSERVQTDAFVHNELGNPDEMLSDRIPQWRSYNHLTPLGLAFDVTPPDLVTAVVTELGILPCTSVPVVLRIKPSESII